VEFLESFEGELVEESGDFKVIEVTVFQAEDFESGGDFGESVDFDVAEVKIGEILEVVAGEEVGA
jgi:hypothetical protein